MQTLQAKAPELVDKLNKNVGFGMGLEFREGKWPGAAGRVCSCPAAPCRKKL